jgi:hypothetical protein
MIKRSNSLTEAQEKYEKTRVTVSCKMLKETELKRLDKARGDQSRTAFVKQAVLALIEERSKIG